VAGDKGNKEQKSNAQKSAKTGTVSHSTRIPSG
jgi:hypothetical protein